ncbi:MAG: hypothetical protein FWG50_12435, partial [Kiritimatiellaeota bacterium]|nr:hypothetical protein [Kiritimatiellota bacterium]
MKTSLRFLLFVLATAPVAFADTFSLDAIERWTGTGSCRAALVIDWHDGTRPHALAWGFRFDPPATGLDMLNAITAADPGLSVTLDGGLPARITYGRPTRPGDILPETADHPGLARATAYTFDHADPGNGLWNYWTCDAQPAFARDGMTPCAAPPAARPLADGAWDAWTLTTDTIPAPPAAPAAALHYPFATEVVSYTQGGTVTRDWISGAYFNNPLTALGRPTVDTTGDTTTVPTSYTVPVVPVYAAFRAHEIVSLGLSGGEIILGFDHRVYDNPDNPYGAALIVFGNTFQPIDRDSYWHFGDPALARVGGECNDEGGEVYVSQNPGGPWHKVSGVAGAGYADDFAPTLGRVYDPSRPATALIDGQNEWWGGATDPTIPVDPAVLPADLTGMTAADIARRYRGSAGGTAFSIRALPLPADPDNGMKWIRYVRITSENTWDIPEVDAVADVSPALPVNLWRDDHFPWLGDPALEADDADPDNDGTPNFMEYALGRDPRSPAPPADLYTLQRYRAPDGLDVFAYTFTLNPAARDVFFGVVRADDLRAPPAAWTTAGTRVVR